MKNYIPTIEELQCIATPELSVIFRKAAAVACNPRREPTERAAAKKTMENVRRRQCSPPQP